MALNVAALATAVEFGVQPVFFHDADGTPLYAPYSAIALPAMMIGHLGVAGIAELAVSAGLVAYLQRSESDLLTWRAGNTPLAAPRSAWSSTHAVGRARGTDRRDAGRPDRRRNRLGRVGRRRFRRRAGAPGDRPGVGRCRATGGRSERTSSDWRHLWQAPMPDYVPAFIANANAGYIASALIGCALIVLAFLIVGRFIGRRPSSPVAVVRR